MTMMMKKMIGGMKEMKTKMSEVHENHKQVLNKAKYNIREAIASSLIVRAMQQGMPTGFTGRNLVLKLKPKNRYALCPCGSGEKYKFCCGKNKHEERQKERLNVQSSSAS